MSSPQVDKPVSLRWKNGRVESVFLATNWQDELPPGPMLRAVVDEFRGSRGPQGTWRSRVRLRDIPLDRMDDFVDAVRAAQRESPVPTTQERRTAHVVSRWAGSELLSLGGDLSWMAAAPRQAVADELLEHLDVDPHRDGPAVTRLMRMMER